VAWIQFLSGGRDQQLQELNPKASLTLGSGDPPGVHIQCKDPGIQPEHCRIYPSPDGSAFWLQNLSPDTILNMQRLQPNKTHQLADRAVFIVGRTFVKFWLQKPATGLEGAGGGGGGADTSAVEAELKQAKDELEKLRSSGASGQELDEQRRATEAAQAEVKELEGKLADVKKELEAAQKAKEEAEGARHTAESELTQAKAKAESDLEAARKEAEEAKAQASREAESELEAAKAGLAKEKEELEGSLEATRTALEALREEQSAAGGDPIADLAGSLDDLHAALDALELPDAARRQLMAVVRSEIDREVIRRAEGPVVPVRGLRVPGSGRDLEAELLSVKERGAQVDAARDLDLADLGSEELDRLLELARA